MPRKTLPSVRTEVLQRPHGPRQPAGYSLATIALARVPGTACEPNGRSGNEAAKERRYPCKAHC
jgi:hypothetical protein